jgi:hypothetical protein
MEALLQFLAGVGIFVCGWFLGSSYGFVRGITRYKRYLDYKNGASDDIDEELF